MPNRELQSNSRSSDTFAVGRSRIEVELLLADDAVEKFAEEAIPGFRLLRVCEGLRVSTETAIMNRRRLLKLNKRHMACLEQRPGPGIENMGVTEVKKVKLLMVFGRGPFVKWVL